MIFEHDANDNTRNYQGDIELHRAAVGCKLGVVGVFSEHGTDVITRTTEAVLRCNRPSVSCREPSILRSFWDMAKIRVFAIIKAGVLCT